MLCPSRSTKRFAHCAKSPASPDPNKAFLKKLLLAYLRSENEVHYDWIYAATKGVPAAHLSYLSLQSTDFGTDKDTAAAPSSAGLHRRATWGRLWPAEPSAAQAAAAEMSQAPTKSSPNTPWHLELSHWTVTLLSPSWSHPPLQTKQGCEKSPSAGSRDAIILLQGLPSAMHSMIMLVWNATGNIFLQRQSSRSLLGHR